MNKIQRLKDIIHFAKKQGIVELNRDFGVLLGYKKDSILSSMLGGSRDIPQNMGRKIKLSILPNLNLEWWETGNGVMLEHEGQTNIGNVNGTNVVAVNTQNTIINNAPASPLPKEEAGDVEEPEELEEIPVVPRCIYTEPNVNILEYVQNNDVQMSPRIHQLSQYDLCYMVVNDEMSPYICAGDRIYLWAYPEGKERKIIDGRVYSVDTKLNGVLTRQLYKLENGFLAKSFNPRYADEILEWEDIYRVYRIVGVLRMDE